jgi:hypothetical protein
VGSLLSFIFGWSSQFHSNLAVYYGVVGIYITTATIWYGSRSNYSIYDSFLLCFDISDDDRTKIVENTLDRYSANARHIRTGLIVFLLAFAVAYIGFFSPGAEVFLKRYLGITTLRFTDFQTAGWYEPGVATKAFPITLLFALFISFPLATGYRLISRMPWLLLQTARNSVTMMPRFIKAKFAKLTAFYTIVSLIWTVGATLIAVLFRGGASFTIRAFLIALVMLGVINVVVPQVIYAIVAVKAEVFWLGHANRAVEKRCNSQSNKSNGMDFVLEIDPYYLEYDKWVYPVHETYLIVLAQGISLIGLQALAALPKL